jgi:hypothetical protein
MKPEYAQYREHHDQAAAQIVIVKSQSSGRKGRCMSKKHKPACMNQDGKGY